jgi:hypothetical protein
MRYECCRPPRPLQLRVGGGVGEFSTQIKVVSADRSLKFFTHLYQVIKLTLIRMTRGLYETFALNNLTLTGPLWSKLALLIW